ncbi:SDR family NAD(P)-dependent oxidoreductase [Sinorhizobium meliloti]|nr:SDR family NAD(P)-dependent oxidoreductase [Sinorhizobium meliloti]MDX0243440.1 SDR family NAD(P)-dependent oxidoreductase [Sinorhizobium meliloti]MDX0399275.1 SDR family NAD(P)-dependent oxidoreductase [Sinorhizobium meliloti]
MGSTGLSTMSATCGQQALGDVDLDAPDAILRLNLHPGIRAVQAALPRMRANGRSRVVNICSLTVGIAERTAYAAAKGLGQLHQDVGARTRANRHYGQCSGARPDRTELRRGIPVFDGCSHASAR